MSKTIKPRYLVMVTANNNNKYYKQIPHGDTWTAEYGRVGSSPQTAEYSMGKWESKYKEKIRKGYVDQSELIEDLIAIDKRSDNTYKVIEDQAIAEIVERLQQLARQAISENYTVASNKVTKAMVDEAQKILENLVIIKRVDLFNDELIRLFSAIPRKMSEVSYFLATTNKDFSEIIKREQDLLDVMKGQVVQVEAEKEENTGIVDDNQKTILEALGITFEVCEEQDIQIIKDSLGENKHRFKQAWKVTNIRTQKRFDEFTASEKINEIKYLWHGSRNENWWSIINSGLVLRPTNAIINGKMFGYGIYYAPRAQKSIGYTSLSGAYWTSGHAATGFLALMEVAYGKPYDVYSFDSKYYDFNYEKLQKTLNGANSLHAHAGSMLKNDEIIVYKEEQSTIKYLVEIY
ncbi:ADP-ribose polymerase [Lacrimispora amygdalina]|uniref:ADP-ribose polymerase n=1 Tax=Lacrimispora amygdalina TaxID=253257 RepID=UPI00114508AD|nr:ADP-ribose polymerase [Lacrimispora amygdalina]